MGRNPATFVGSCMRPLCRASLVQTGHSWSDVERELCPAQPPSSDDLTNDRSSPGSEMISDSSSGRLLKGRFRAAKAESCRSITTEQWRPATKQGRSHQSPATSAIDRSCREGSRTDRQHSAPTVVRRNHSPFGKLPLILLINRDSFTCQVVDYYSLTVVREGSVQQKSRSSFASHPGPGTMMVGHVAVDRLCVQAL